MSVSFINTDDAGCVAYSSIAPSHYCVYFLFINSLITACAIDLIAVDVFI